MRLIFAGTPEFAAIALKSLLAAGHHIGLVLTQPDRPAGRGLKLHPSPVKQLALQHHLPLAQPRSLRLDGKFPDDARAAQLAINQANADVMVVAAYGLILPQWVLDTSAGQQKLGCLNIHASLLPRWRGAAPIHRAIAAGDAQTGVCIMQMDAGLDTGDILHSVHQPIADTDTSATLHDKLAALGAQTLLAVLAQARQGGLKPEKQAEIGITYAHKISKAEAAVDWTQDAAVLARQIRAFNPAPVVFCMVNGEPVKLYAAQQALPQNSEIDSVTRNSAMVCGTILHINQAGITVQCGQGALTLTQLQRPGGTVLAAADFLRGFPLHVGQVLA
ncbi:MAG: methionyl-tRNA formyltransferase [Burkholderiales bacterium]